ncbi:AbgT family transporter [Utexia brackfieldae]|uniref:AbgT family transporter n=1 Tax=Utexia brackfieldae TaxID=3074108 RepID=UPI00370D3F80
MDHTINKPRGFLNRIERIGNAMPNITILFLYALIICWLLSFLLSFIEFDYINPRTSQRIEVINMFGYQQIIQFLTMMVHNFINFPPLGITLVATLGIGIAEGSGFIKTALKKMLKLISPKMLTPTVAFVGIFAHVVSDSAYVIIMPVSALIFYLNGRHPLAGIATAFAGLAGGFSASYTPSKIDPIMQSFTQNAAQIIDSNYTVNVLCNYFLSFGSTFLVIGVCWFITEKIVEPWLNKTCPIDTHRTIDIAENMQTISPAEAKGFTWAGFSIIGLIVLLIVLLYPDSSPFRAPNGSLTSSEAPIMKAIVPLLFIFFAVPGLVYGILSGTFKSSKDVTRSMEKVLTALISFLVFSFFAAQFLYSFDKSNLGALLSLSGAELLKTLHMPSGLTILGVILLTAVINLIITSATSKWAIMAPVLIPMLMSVGISPELTQAAFRISDSAVNVCTPMFAFYPLILSYCNKYCEKAGIGTLCSMMIPYTIGLLIALSAMLYFYWWFDIPLGFDSRYSYIPGMIK